MSSINFLLGITDQYRDIFLTVLWVLGALASYYILFVASKRLARYIPGDLDDTIIHAIRMPVVVSLSVIALFNLLHLFPFSDRVIDLLLRLRNFSIEIMIVVVVWQLFEQVVIYYATVYAEKSESSLDDILLPIIRQLGRIAIAIIGGFWGLKSLGYDLSSLWVALGGGAFILAFALQDILSNIFSGISLVVDTPFKYGDLIELEDGKICRVDRIGVRITELYNIANHTVIYMPNGNLANERLLNITKPNTDLRVTISVGVGCDENPREVRKILKRIAEEHPNVESPIEQKIRLIKDKLPMTEGAERRYQYIQEIMRLKQEDIANKELEDLQDYLEELADYIDEIEDDGLDDEEKESIRLRIDEVRRRVGSISRALTSWVMAIRHRIALPLLKEEEGIEDMSIRLQQYIEHIYSLMDDKEMPVLGDLPVGNSNLLEVQQALRKLVKRSGFENYDRGFRDVDIREEFERIVILWNRKLFSLKNKLRVLEKELKNGNEQRIDNGIRTMGDWLSREFKETTPEWKYPAVNLVEFGDFTLNFELEIQVDDISREHYGRQAQVETEIREEIIEQFGKANITMPSPQQEIFFKTALSTQNESS